MSANLILGNLFVFFSIFPYVSFVPNSLDSQPFSIFFCCLFLISNLFRTKSVPLVWFSILIYFVISFALIVFNLHISGFDFLLARGFINYLTVALVPWGFYSYLERYGFPKKIFIFGILVYLFCGLVQIVISREIFGFLVDVRTTTDRGVTSLAPEPTYYGIVCYFLMLCVIMSNDFSSIQKKIILSILVFQIFLLSMSSMTALFIICMILGYALSKNVITPKILLYLSIIFVSVTFVSMSGYLDNSRLFKLAFLALDKGFSAFSYDASMNERLSQVYLSFYGFVNNYFLPGLFTTFSDFSANRESYSGGFFWYGGDTNKIMSYLGAMAYETGIFILFYFFTVFFAIKGHRVFMTFAFLIPLLSAIPLANPLPGIVLAVCYFNYRKSYEISSEFGTSN
ncbi:hypothetical protein KW477_17075 [Vibrio fluvialis]|uniref:hypothetical protein n=1 Tax=Vibrio fluvialis TaxID=676 RepID=UPI001558BE2B|nr:hypothetical protein [Vibrio fluvialis]MBY8039687.1 hypothetical protein [Vibrio fluvialis]